MSKIERIGVSLEKELLTDFDELIEKQGYQNRSEAIRDLVRQKITEDRLAKPKANAVAVVHLVYDHHETKLMQKLTSLQHSHLLKTICTMHVHLDEHNCMEIIVLKGIVSEIQKMADGILSQKGVKLGKTNFIPSDSH
jgi:CopG family nickel-responsive transcriptional regulator